MQRSVRGERNPLFPDAFISNRLDTFFSRKNGYRFVMCNFVKVYKFLREILSIKIRKSNITCLLTYYLLKLSQFSSPESKAQVRFSDQILSVVRRCNSCRRCSCRRHPIFIFSSRTTGAISTKLDIKHPWVMGIQVCSNKRPAIFQGEMITKQIKYNDEILKTSSPEPMCQFQPNLAQSSLL